MVGIPESMDSFSRVETSGRVVAHPTSDKRHKNHRNTSVLE